MTLYAHRERRGAAVVALMLVAVIILSSMLMLHAAMVVSVGNTSRALEVARQNMGTAVRLERLTREAAQSVYGVSVAAPERSFRDEITTILAAAPLSAVQVEAVDVQGRPTVPRGFPSLQGPPSPLVETGAELGVLCAPEILSMAGPRSAVSPTFSVRYRFSRPVIASTQTYNLGVDYKLVSVPLSRFGIMAYDLPNEIGTAAAPVEWPSGISAESVGPRGLVPDRDPARANALSVGQKRPGYFRYAAALSEAYQYVFSQTYLQNAADCAGQTHFVQIGAGPANPTLAGGTQAGNTYTLDVGQFGDGALGPRVATKNLAVFYATGPGCSLVLSDSGSATTPILLVIAGPSDPASDPLVLRLASSLQRPVVLVCYHVQLEAAGAMSVNGAVFLDRECAVAPTAGPLTVGHLSHWAGGTISVNAFRLRPMSIAAETLAPRVIYVATAKTFL